jgi:sn-glycerol 3-phosphate transport system permease protein
MVLIGGVLFLAFPVWVALIAATHDAADFLHSPMSLIPGGRALANFSQVLSGGISWAGGVPASTMLVNSLAMALGIAFGKIAVSILSAFAIVFFRFPLRQLIFWLILVTLMLPVEVRIVPTFQVVADLGLLDSYAGLTIPLIASATATLLFRQMFLTIPGELVEAARMDGAGPLRFFRDILLPMSRTTIAALFVVLFIYGWNQYLWPLMVTSDRNRYTVVMGLYALIRVPDGPPLWHLVMTTAVLALLPPVAVVIGMQKLFVKGLVDAEK